TAKPIPPSLQQSFDPASSESWRQIDLRLNCFVEIRGQPSTDLVPSDEQFPISQSLEHSTELFGPVHLHEDVWPSLGLRSQGATRDVVHLIGNAQRSFWLRRFL